MMQESVVIQAECKPTCPTSVSPSPSGLLQFYLHPGQTQESVTGINSIMSDKSGKKSGCQTNKSEALCPETKSCQHLPLHLGPFPQERSHVQVAWCPCTRVVEKITTNLT